jgi:phage shock protein PspC (stress-responsive transcriptional regulator)
MNAEVKRLYKSRTDRMIDGVCGGVAKYLNLDPTLVRIALVLLTLLGGSGILLYIIAMIVMPKEPYLFTMGTGATEAQSPDATTTQQASTPSKKNSLFWGILLIVVGTALFLDNVGLDFWRFWWWFDGEMVLAVLLILAGVAFLWGGRNSLHKQPTASVESESGVGPQAQPLQAARRLYRSFTDSKLFGVCGGVGEYFGIDSTIVRILFLIGAFASGGIVVIGYIIMAIALPRATPSIPVA